MFSESRGGFLGATAAYAAHHEGGDHMGKPTIAISVANGAVKVDGANVVSTDLEASNGVIHVIDAVITPGS